jgi:FdhE protein
VTLSLTEPGTVERAASDIPPLRLPERTLFQTRAERFAALATNHALGDYLRFLAALARAQHAALAQVADVSLPSAEQLRLCREHRLPPINAQTWERDPRWRAALRTILETVDRGTVPPETHVAIADLLAADVAAFERDAQALLQGRVADVGATHAPFVAAALQVLWTHLAARLDPAQLASLDVGSICPVCGSPPVASVVRIGAAEHGLRYLTCSLCATQWHMVRVKCSQCETTKDISYFQIEGGSPAVKAEHCEQCGSYLKIFYMEKEPQLEPVADDVASLSLDLLMAENGVQRSGLNYFLLGGST